MSEWLTFNGTWCNMGNKTVELHASDSCGAVEVDKKDVKIEGNAIMVRLGAKVKRIKGFGN